jgi:anti-sigma B factor antagonist
MFSVNLNTRSYEGYAVVALRGELDLADAAAVAAELAQAAAGGPGIIVELARLDFIDCSGVAALQCGRGLARQAGGDLALVAPHRNVMRVLDIIHLGEAFFVYATVEEAAREAGQINAGQINAGQINAGQINAGQINAGQINAGQIKEWAMVPPQLPRKARWPSGLLWSRTDGLRTLPSSHAPSVPGPEAAGFLPPAETDPEEQAERGCH